MSLLNSKFDIVSVDNPLALAALAQVLEVNTLPNPMFNDNGTAKPGTIPPGAIVKMDETTGKAVLASSPALGTMATMPVVPFVVLDGNMDYSGSFVQKLTVLHGGFTMITDQYNAGSYTPGVAVTFASGKVAVAVSGNQILGFVGPAGEDTVNGTVQIIVPQGCGLAYLPTHTHA